ncbi:MAG: tRNA guanosine(34) transglycosylase Tgt [Bacteroidetes bacterium]|nr:tRNA guanosine(34) transglycosylase Tgt [Bacteroidota bacterium]
MKFEILQNDKNTAARNGKLVTDHGDIETPLFMPVGTAGTVKAVHFRELRQDIDAKIILGNTYHLYLRPGIEILQKAGGLHGFNGWDRAILTDSGGYQVYSLAQNRKITPEGIVFQSHIDGSKHFFTPEGIVDIQRIIGADIMMAFDECPPYPCDYQYAEQSMKLTHAYLKRCFTQFNETSCPHGHTQALFPIVQGSTYSDLRKISAEFVADIGAEGNAIGGLSVGEPAEEMYAITEQVCSILPKDKPRYLMGVGTPVNLLEGIALGVDMFDCVMPTRNARNGMLFTWDGIINILNNKWKDDFTPVFAESKLFADREYSRAYLRHLFKSNEILASQISTLHNLHFYISLMQKAREKISEGVFPEWKNTMVKQLGQRI